MKTASFRTAGLGLYLALILGTSAVRAADDGAGTVPSPPDAAKGLVLAEKLCSNCHLVRPDLDGAAIADVPTFMAIANDPDQTHQRLTGFMVAPHPPMPDTRLTRAEILHLIAYLDSLRDPGAGPPLLPPEQPEQKRPEREQG